MEQMIKEYEAEHKRLGERLAELRRLVRTEKLKTKELECIKLRIYMITQERTELRHNIRAMEQIIGGIS